VTVTRLVAIVLAALSLLPIATWLPGGEQDAGYVGRLTDWMSGTALCVGTGVLVWMWTRRRVATAAGTREEEQAAARGDAGTAFLVGLSLAAGALYLLIARVVFSGQPLLIDELIQVLQAQWFAAGRLGVPTPPDPQFFSVMHLIDQGPLTYSQYPAGGPAMLALGAWADAAWVVNPLCGALTVYLFGDLLRAVEPQASRRWHRAVVTLFALAPFWAFMAGSHMNHVTTLLWTVAAMACLVRATRPMPAWGWGLATGWCLGMATTIRPLDGAVVALPAGLWLCWRARGRLGAPHAPRLGTRHRPPARRAPLDERAHHGRPAAVRVRGALGHEPRPRLPRIALGRRPYPTPGNRAGESVPHATRSDALRDAVPGARACHPWTLDGT
jgi:hypothetical protein